MSVEYCNSHCVLLAQVTNLNLALIYCAHLTCLLWCIFPTLLFCYTPLRSARCSNITKTDAGRPAIAANTAITAYIVESWAPQGAGKSTRSIHAYSNAPYVRLLLNGAQVGADSPMPPFGSVNWPTVAYAPGILTLQALSGAGGSVLASHTRTSWGAPAAIVLTCDSPSPLTGTGSAVYLDGTDVALLRATVMDAAGVIVADSTLNITFSVTDGPGLVLGEWQATSNRHGTALICVEYPHRPSTRNLESTHKTSQLVLVAYRCIRYRRAMPTQYMCYIFARHRFPTTTGIVIFDITHNIYATYSPITTIFLPLQAL